MRRLSLLVLACSLSGCLLYFDDGGESCPLDEVAVGDTAAPAQALRNPDTLTCEVFGGGGTCDPACGPCPAAELAPIPTWGSCGSACEGLDEGTCGSRSDCRVVKDARCAIQLDCLTDYVGCFPVDQLADPELDCRLATDGQACSRNPQCTAFHRTDGCGSEDCPREFALCMPEGQHPGQCFANAICDIPAPPCPRGTLPGIEAGCYTGACIPLDLCEARPPQPR